MQPRVGRVGADGVPDRGERGGQLDGGEGQRHGGLRSVEEGADRGELPAGGGEAVLQPAQVRVQHRTGVSAGQQRPHVGQRQADPAQPGDEPGRRHLVGPVAPVAGARVHRRRHQHAGPVVEPQRADRQPARAGQLTDAQQVALHVTGPFRLDLLESQLRSAVCRARTPATLARQISSHGVGRRPSAASLAAESSTYGRTNW